MEPKPASQPLPQPLCPFCSSPVDITDFFCPVCGKNIKEKPIATGTLVQIGLYLVSVLLPPLFIGWTIRYLKSKDPVAKQIGMISLGLTIVSLTITVWLTIVFVQNMTQSINQQLNQFKGL